MIDQETARKLVKTLLLQREAAFNAFGSDMPAYVNRQAEFVIAREEEYEFGWVFYYNTKKYLEDRNLRDRLIGNAPFIVDRFDGRIYVTGTGETMETYIQRYRNGERKPAD